MYRISDGSSRGVSIEKHAACVEGFYNGHPIDKEWSSTVEARWPSTRQKIFEWSTTDQVAEELLKFLAVQVVRNRSYMNLVAADIAEAESSLRQIDVDGKIVRVKYVDYAKTSSVMDVVQRHAPTAEFVLRQSYNWVVLHAAPPTFFITGDEPTAQEKFVACFPISSTMCLVGTLRETSSNSTIISHKKASTVEVAIYNAMIVRNCTQHVYACEKSATLSEFVLKHNIPYRQPSALGSRFRNQLDPLPDTRMAEMLRAIEKDQQSREGL